MTTPDAPRGLDPVLDDVGTFHVRRSGTELDDMVGAVLGLIEQGVTLVDVAHHDRAATTVVLRAMSHARS